MPGPWEKYQTATPAQAGPWGKYKQAAAPAPAVAPVAPAENGAVHKLSQFGSGAEEGLLGLSDFAHAMVTPGGAGPYVSDLVSAIFRPGAPSIAPSAPLHEALSTHGLIAPATDDPGDKITRSIGSALGGAVIPEVGLEGLTATALKGLIPAVTSGLGGGIASVVAPNNPAAQIAGELIGGIVPSTAMSTARRALDNSSGFETATGQPVPKKLVKAVERDHVTPADTGAAVADLGPAATVADVGDNTQKLAMGIATQPGEAGAKISNAMKGRAKDSMTRVPSAVNDTLGPATPPSEIQADIKANMKTLGPEYEQALAGAQPVDTAALASDLDTQGTALRGPAQTAAQQVRAMLNDETGQALDTSASTLFQVRNAIDDMLSGNVGGNTKRVLSSTRGQIDQLLAGAAPGIKDIDAKYHELGRQGRGVEAGGAVLDGGKSAVWPQENAAAVAEGVQPAGSLVGPSAAAFRMSQGARAEIERMVGTKVNDRRALASMVGGETDWNPQKLAQLFGQDKADAIMKLVEQERRLAETENLAVHGTKTAAATAAQNDLGTTPLTPSSARGRTVVDAVFGALDAATRHAMSKHKAGKANDIADVILGRGDWQKTNRQFYTPEQRNAMLAAVFGTAANGAGQ